MTEDEKVANRIANDLVKRANGFADRRQPIGVAVLIAQEERAAELHSATAARWKSMLSAYSSGIAHADQDVDTRPAETTLAQLQKLEIVAANRVQSASATSCVLVVTDAARLPAHVVVAYAAMSLDPAWRAALALAGAAIVDVNAD